MKLGINVKIIALSSFIFISCGTKKIINENYNDSFLQEKSSSTSEYKIKRTNSSFNFEIHLDSIVKNRFKFDATDTSYLFAQIKNGKIEIVYIRKNDEEIIEKKTTEQKEETKKETKISKKEVEKKQKNLPFIGMIGILIFLIGFLLFFGNRKN
jgi:hypothetical protein